MPKILNAYLGQNITITCKYPGEYEKHYKYVNTVNGDTFKRILDTNTRSQNGRFSISEDRSAKVVLVNICDVREADEAFYLVWNGDGSVKYYSYFTDIQLHVTVNTLCHFENKHLHKKFNFFPPFFFYM